MNIEEMIDKVMRLEIVSENYTRSEVKEEINLMRNISTKDDEEIVRSATYLLKLAAKSDEKMDKKGILLKNVSGDMEELLEDPR